MLGVPVCLCVSVSQCVCVPGCVSVCVLRFTGVLFTKIFVSSVRTLAIALSSASGKSIAKITVTRSACDENPRQQLEPAYIGASGAHHHHQFFVFENPKAFVNRGLLGEGGAEP